MCRVGGDCISGRCSGYHCTGASTCLANLYFCTLGVRDANGCPCLKEKGSGFIRAAIQPQQVGFACGDCNTTQDCIDKHGPDAWCAEDNGDLCGCAPGQGFCTLPC